MRDFASFEWHTKAYGADSVCRLRHYQTPVGHFVVFTELFDNPGPSITNGIESLISTAAKALGLCAEETVWLEHYARSSYRDSHETPRFTRIRLGGEIGPAFEHFPPGIMAELAGSALLEE